jgi:hypothetical protein
MKQLLTAWALVIAAVASAQNPQSQTAPTFAVNAKYVNGVAPGYAPTPGSGLNVALGPGTANCSGTIITYAGGTLALTASTTNYVYLNTSGSCAPAVKTSVFVASDIPLATVVTGISAVTSITDVRTPFVNPLFGAGGAYCTLTGCILAGQLNVGTTQFIDSSFYSSFALACAAAVTANAPLLVSKSWIAIPTGTCAANLQFWIGTGSAILLQPASGATLTLTGTVTAPVGQIFDLSAGGLIAWSSPSLARPEYWGALDNGANDDSPALSAAIQAQLANDRALALSAGTGYLVKESINGTCSNAGQRINITGAGMLQTTIIHELTDGPYGVLDIGGCSEAQVSDLQIQPYGNNLANSQATAAIIIGQGSYSDSEAGGDTRVERVAACAGSGAGVASLFVRTADLVTVRDGEFGCGGSGTGILVGGSTGLATSVRSKFYNLPALGYGNTTNVTLDNNIAYGDYAPAVQLTGSRAYYLHDRYDVLVGGGTGGSIIAITATYGAGNTIFCQGLNTENQSSATGVAVFNLGDGINGMNCTGAFSSDPGGFLLGGTAAAILNNVTLDDQSGAPLGLFSFHTGATYGGTIYNSNITAAYGVSSLGTITNLALNGSTLNARGIALGTLETLRLGQGNTFIGINGDKGSSDARAGTWTITSSTTATVYFPVYLNTTPTQCTVTPTSSTATTGAPFVTGASLIGFTVNVPTSGTLSGTYYCTYTI